MEPFSNDGFLLDLDGLNQAIFIFFGSIFSGVSDFRLAVLDAVSIGLVRQLCRAVGNFDDFFVIRLHTLNVAINVHQFGIASAIYRIVGAFGKDGRFDKWFLDLVQSTFDWVCLLGILFEAEEKADSSVGIRIAVHHAVLVQFVGELHAAFGHLERLFRAEHTIHAIHVATSIVFEGIAVYAFRNLLGAQGEFGDHDERNLRDLFRCKTSEKHG